MTTGRESLFADGYEPLSSIDHPKDERDAHRIAWLEHRNRELEVSRDDWAARQRISGSAAKENYDAALNARQRATIAEGERDYLREALARAVLLAQGLMGMIDRDTWRDCGGDDGQGHYEGDYHAERIETELRALSTLAEGKNAAPDGQSDYSGLDA